MFSLEMVFFNKSYTSFKTWLIYKKCHKKKHEIFQILPFFLPISFRDLLLVNIMHGEGRGENMVRGLGFILRSEGLTA